MEQIRSQRDQLSKYENEAFAEFIEASLLEEEEEKLDNIQQVFRGPAYGKICDITGLLM